MFKYYEKTSCRYLIWCVPSIILFILVAITDLVRGEKVELEEIICQMAILILYIICAIPSAAKTFKERNVMRKIIAEGEYVIARVTKIQMVSKHFKNPSDAKGQELYLYRVVAERIDGYGIRKEYFSDLILEDSIKTVPMEVKVYSYHNQRCFVWEKAQVKIKHKIEDDLETVTASARKANLINLNRFLIVILIIFILGIFTESMLKKF